MIKQNLTWSAAAKFYIAAVGLIATYVTANIDSVPDWVSPVLVVLTGLATWLKSQTPATEPIDEPV